MRSYLWMILVGLVLTPGNLGKHTSCDDGWIPDEGFCYWFGSDKMNFTEAELYCSHRESHLIDIFSSSENNFIKDRMRKLKPHCYWLGLTDALTEGEWRWDNTHGIANFTDWYPGQPGHDGEEDCVVFWTDFNYKWGDYPCTQICEPVCKRSGFVEVTSEIVG